MVQPELTPDPASWQETLALREAGRMFQAGLDTRTVEAEEAAWSQLVKQYSGSEEPWAKDLVARALGNRGNARSRQGRFTEALADYNAAVKVAPYAVDPVLNRGVVLEALGRFEEACSDYRAVLAAAPGDPAAWNNLGNATGGLGRWSEAAEYYRKASSLSPDYAFSSNNYALAQFQTGDQTAAVRLLRSVLRRYPDFDDARAGLAACLWSLGLYEDAETNWLRVGDIRYRDRSWLMEQRRWPPAVAAGLNGLLSLRASDPVPS